MTMTELFSGDEKARNVTDTHTHTHSTHTHTHTHTHSTHIHTHTHTHTVSGRIMAYTKMDIVKRNRKTAAYLRLELTRQPSKPYE